MIIASDGEFSAVGTTFDLDGIEFRQGSALHSGGVTGNTFSNPIFTTVAHLLDTQPNLKSNVLFENVEFWPGQVIASGQTLHLSPLGVAPDANMRFNLNPLTVEAGGQLFASTGARLQINEGAQIAIDGAMAIEGAASFTMVDGSRFNLGDLNTLRVNAGGVFTIADTQLVRSGAGDDRTALILATGGRLAVSNARIDLDDITVESSSTVEFYNSNFDAKLFLRSDVTYDVAQNDFADVTVEASGPLTRPDQSPWTIDLRDNWWVTNDATAIEAKILHQLDDANRPLVEYEPALSLPPVFLGSIEEFVFLDINGNGDWEGAEPTSGGVTVFLDSDNDGELDTDEPRTVSQVDDPATPLNEQGWYVFRGLPPGSYVVREAPPANHVQTAPSLTAATHTIQFGGEGDEDSVTEPGISAFSLQGAKFAGGAVILPANASLTASASAAYDAENATVAFDHPVDTVEFFFVHGSGFATGTATLYDALGNVLGSVDSRAATTMNDASNFVSFDPAVAIARIEFSGGVMDDFEFTTVAGDPAWQIAVGEGDHVAGIVFGNRSLDSDPIANDDAATTSRNDAIVVDVLDNDADPDGDTLLLEGFTQGGQGAVTRLDNGTPLDTSDDLLRYTPAPSFVGQDTFTYTISDGNGGFAIATVTVDVTDAPYTMDVQLRVVSSPTTSNSTALPTGIASIATGGTFYLEVWVQEFSAAGTGVTGGEIDLRYDTALADGVAVVNAEFDLLPNGVIEDAVGLIDNLGGGTNATDRGAAPQWARLAYVEFTATGLGTQTFRLEPGEEQFSVASAGLVEWGDVDLTDEATLQVRAGGQLNFVVVSTPTATNANGEVDRLPTDAPLVHEWQGYYVEVYATTVGNTHAVTGANFDLVYDAAFTTAASVEAGPAFTLGGATIDDVTGRVSGISVGSGESDLGDDLPVLLARIRFELTGSDQSPLDEVNRVMGPYDLGLGLESAQWTVAGATGTAATGAPPATELWAVPYDIDDNNRIDFSDIAFFTPAFAMTVTATQPPFTWWADFDRSGFVDFGDFSFFAVNFRISRGEAPILLPGNFPPASGGGEGENGPGSGFLDSPAARELLAALHAAGPYQNERHAIDVNNDGRVTSNDALRVVNALNGLAPTDSFLDGNGDGTLSPNDVLRVVNDLNRRAAMQLFGEGEGSPRLTGLGTPAAALEPGDLAERNGSLAGNDGEGTRSGRVALDRKSAIADLEDPSSSASRWWLWAASDGRLGSVPNSWSAEPHIAGDGSMRDELEDIVDQLAGDIGANWDSAHVG